MLNVLYFFCCAGLLALLLIYVVHREQWDQRVLRVKRLDSCAVLPKRGNPYAAGLDLFLLYAETLKPGETRLLRTGIAMEIPTGFYGDVMPRSSAFKKGLIIQGTVDSDYRGEVFVMVTNVSGVERSFNAYTALAQIIVKRYENLPVLRVSELSTTERGDGGFGSTGNTGT